MTDENVNTDVDTIKNAIKNAIDSQTDDDQDDTGITSIQINKSIKNKLNAIKTNFQDVLQSKISFSDIIKILISNSNGGDLDNSLTSLIKNDGVKQVLSGTLNAANKCTMKIKQNRHFLEHYIPKDLFEEWLLCICNRDVKTLVDFRLTINRDPICYSDKDLNILFKLLYDWKQSGKIRDYDKKIIETYMIRYIFYVNLLKKINKNIIKNDIGQIGQASGFIQDDENTQNTNIGGVVDDS